MMNHSEWRGPSRGNQDPTRRPLLDDGSGRFGGTMDGFDRQNGMMDDRDRYGETMDQDEMMDDRERFGMPMDDMGRQNDRMDIQRRFRQPIDDMERQNGNMEDRDNMFEDMDDFERQNRTMDEDRNFDENIEGQEDQDGIMNAQERQGGPGPVIRPPVGGPGPVVRPPVGGPGPVRPPVGGPGPGRPEPDRPGPGRPEPDRPGPGRPGPGGPGPGRPEPDRPGPGRPEPGRPGPFPPRPRPRPPIPVPPRRQNQIWVTDAYVNSVQFAGGVTYVTIVYRDFDRPGRGRTQSVTLVVSNQTLIQTENGRSVPPASLRVGTIISALFSNAFTRSIPPQTRAFLIIVQEFARQSESLVGRIIQVDQRNRFITVITGNQINSAIRFNVTEFTDIFGIAGQRISLFNLFPGLNVQVEYADFLTASIPPQTTAFVIQVIR